ncbi:MAG TPA: RNaseH domain-containing protein [Spirillospora sp.]|nr:RNaseH domain-containing protein [Spirillospora sp.]
MLQTSAFRLPADLLGHLWVYPLPDRFQEALADLGTRWRKSNDRARAPHASLANALTAVTGRPVAVLPRTRMKAGDVLLVTTEPIPTAVLGMAVREWERLCRGSDRNVLAPMLADTAPVRTPLAGAVRRPAPGRVSAEPWIYRVLAWIMAERLSTAPVPFDGRKVPFRLDSRGGLIAWDDLVLKERRGKRPARAMLRITPHIKTMPGCGDLVCVLDVGVVRLRESLYGVRNVWIDHGRAHGGSALLRLPVGRYKGDDVLGDFSADIVTACGLDALPWGPEVLREHPDRVRASRAANAEHPIGPGAGPRTYLRLIEHAAEVFDAEPVTYRPFTAPRQTGRPAKVTVRAKADGERLGPGALDRAVEASGYERLRIVHLTGTPAERKRIRDELNRYRDAGTPELTPELGVVQPLTGRADAAGHDVADMINGGTVDSAALLAQAPTLNADRGTLVLALVETAYQGEEIEDDPKPRLRRALAKLGVASQFLAERDPQDGEDHPAGAAVRDLMRVGGFTDERLVKATALEPYPLNRPAWLVGAHIRRQNANGRGARPRLVTVLVAVRAHTVADRPWEVRLYVPGRGWLPHAQGVAAIHAGPLGTEIRSEQDSFAGLRDLVDQALGTLPGGGRDAIVVMVDAEASRRAWPGLGDQRLGEGALPGDGLDDARDITVVRVCSNETEMPRPVHRSVGGVRPRDPNAPATPGSALYVHEGDDGTRSWILGRTSRTYGASADGRCGAAFTRLTLPVEKKHLQGKPWHSFTGTEFVIAREGLFPAEAAATLTARLCAQPLSWDDRTRWPVPLHLARIVDTDHPAYRTEADCGDKA